MYTFIQIEQLYHNCGCNLQNHVKIIHAGLDDMINTACQSNDMHTYYSALSYFLFTPVSNKKMPFQVYRLSLGLKHRYLGNLNYTVRQLNNVFSLAAGDINLVK